MTNIIFPNEWIEVMLDEVVDKIVGGGTPSKAIPSYFQGDIPWMTVKDMNKFVLNDTVDHISEEAVRDSATNIIPAGTPIIATRMSLGKLVRATFDSAINQDLKAIFINEKVSKIYFEYWYRSIAQKIQEMGTGTTVKGIRLEDIKQLSFAVAPLAEQQQIAQKLDELLAQLDTLKTRLDAIPKILKRFRQSVLAAAVSGRLTEERRGSYNQDLIVDELKNEKEALIKKKSIKSDLLVKVAESWFEIPENWPFLELQSFAVKITDGEHQTPKRESSGHYLLSARNVRDGTIDLTKVDYVGETEFIKLRKRCDPNKGDILISCSGSVGRIALVDKDDEYVMVRSAALVKTLSNYVNNTFLMFVLQSHYLQKQIDEKSKSTAQANLFLGQIKELGIPFPPLEEQTEIVRRVEQLFAYADQIEQRVKDAQARVNHLAQSILAKAFRGELTADWRAENPALISGENSAAALLERIKAEREATAKPKKKVRA